jgi:hypothetical protein
MWRSYLVSQCEGRTQTAGEYEQDAEGNFWTSETECDRKLEKTPERWASQFVIRNKVLKGRWHQGERNTLAPNAYAETRKPSRILVGNLRERRPDVKRDVERTVRGEVASQCEHSPKESEYAVTIYTRIRKALFSNLGRVVCKSHSDIFVFVWVLRGKCQSSASLWRNICVTNSL